MLNELKDQQRELKRKIKDAREQEVEKALKGFMELILDDKMPMEIKESTIIESYKITMINIFNE